MVSACEPCFGIVSGLAAQLVALKGDSPLASAAAEPALGPGSPSGNRSPAEVPADPIRSDPGGGGQVGLAGPGQESLWGRQAGRAPLGDPGESARVVLGSAG